ncbi:hypothetical protein AHiyo6_11180 [Arthrobacter sp. Hiyo6]|nr:hypothetical protein AHiyo6_11180 [Arthrobacter sp. Hiyo6]
MKPKAQSPITTDLSCEVCGQMPEPTKTRLTVANVAVMLPIELLVHAAVVETQLPYVAKVLVLTLTATVLVIWVAEPSAARLLRRWLHAPALRHRKRLSSAQSLWRARTILRDQPGSLQKITQSLARLDTNILSIHIHPVAGGVLDEFVLSAPDNLGERELLEAAGRRGQAPPRMAHHGAGHGRRANQGSQPGRPDRRQSRRVALGRCGTPVGQNRTTATGWQPPRGWHVDGSCDHLEDPHRVERPHHLLAARRTLHSRRISTCPSTGRAG